MTIETNKQFSSIELNLEKIKNNESRLRAITEKPFTESENSPRQKAERISKSIADVHYFDKVYFTSDMYSDGFYEPCEMHDYIYSICQINGVHTVLGPREHGKTVDGKKLLIWLMITGKIDIGGVLCETLPKASNILNDLFELISMNQRIVSDFETQFIENNADQLRFTTSQNRGVKTISAFSQGRSVRGFTKAFGRCKFILVDDLETLESSMSAESVELRIKKLSEAFQSMSTKQRTILVLGNDFEEKGALHRLRIEFEQGILNKLWTVKVFKAWDNGRPLWISKFPNVKSENELKDLIGVVSESDWQGNFQQNPIPNDGDTFKREFLQLVDYIPSDARGVVYCDPNLSLKGKGDTTGMTKLLYSPSEDKYFIANGRCKSFSDSNDLLDALFALKDNSISSLHMDGHVAQESLWTNNMRNYARQKKVPYPRIIFARYKIDFCAKNAAYLWNTGKVYVSREFAESVEGRRYLQQLFAFAGKKFTIGKDDAPDSFVGANEALHERHLDRKKVGIVKSILTGGFKNNFGLD